MKRFIIVALATILAVGGVSLVASPASAHTPNITASCSGVHLTATAYDGSKANKWSVTIGGDSQNGTFGATLDKTFAVPQGGATTSWSATIQAFDGSYKTTQSGSVGPCGSLPHVTATAPSVSDPTCSADGKLTIPSKTGVVYSQNPSGTGPGTYTVTAAAASGYILDGTKSWTLTVQPKLTGSQCDVSVTPAAPGKNPPTCQADGTVKVPTTTGVTYTVTDLGTRQFKVVATPKAGYKFPGGATTEWTITVDPKLTGTQCDIEVTPVAPDVSTITKCNTYGSVVPATTTGVNYELTVGNGKEGAWTVVASPKAGYKFDSGATQKVYSGDLGTYTLCVATPVSPNVKAITDCDMDGSVVLPNTEGVAYAITEGNGKTGLVKVVATAKPGYKLADGAQTVFTADLGTHTTCVTPAAPGKNPPTCQAPGSVKLPTTPGVTYATVDEGNNTFLVTATAESGYKLKGQSTWTVVVDPKKTGTDCDIPVTPVAPSVHTIMKCGEDGSITVATTVGVTYTLTEGNGRTGAFTVTATANTGYAFEPGVQTVFTGNLGNRTECVTPVAPAVKTITDCDMYGSVTPADTEGITYALTKGDGKEGAWEVTASTKPGYEFADNVQTVFSGNLGTHTTCDTPVTPVAPTVEAITKCDAYGSLTLPITEGVTYVLTDGDGRQGAYTVTATAEPGYTFASGTQSVFTGDLGKHTTCVTPVAPQIAALAGCGKDGSLTYNLTEGVQYTLTEGDGKSGTYTIEATALEGFKFPAGTVTTFTGDLGSKTSCPVTPEGNPDNPTTPSGHTTTDSGLPNTGGPAGTLALLGLGMGCLLLGGATLFGRRRDETG